MTTPDKKIDRLFWTALMAAVLLADPFLWIAAQGNAV